MMKLSTANQPTRTKKDTRKTASKVPVSAPFPPVAALRQSLRLNQQEMARLMGISVRALFSLEKEGKPLEGANRRHYEEAVRLRDALAELLQPEYIGKWITSPNESLRNLSPLQMIESGQTDQVWQIIWATRYGHYL